MTDFALQSHLYAAPPDVSPRPGSAFVAHGTCAEKQNRPYAPLRNDWALPADAVVERPLNARKVQTW